MNNWICSHYPNYTPVPYSAFLVLHRRNFANCKQVRFTSRFHELSLPCPPTAHKHQFKLQVTNSGCILSIADETQNSWYFFLAKETPRYTLFCSSTHKQMGVGIWKSAPLRTKYAAYMYAELSSHILQYKIDHSPVLAEYTPMYMVWMTFIVSGISQW